MSWARSICGVRCQPTGHSSCKGSVAAACLPSSSSSAEQRLAELRAAQARSAEAVPMNYLRAQPLPNTNRWAGTEDQDDSGELGRAPRQVDIRMYEGLSASRNRLSKLLSESKRKAGKLEEIIQQKDDALVAAFDCLTRTLSEYKNLQNLSSGAAAGVQFGVSQEDALRKLLILQERIEFMHERIAESRAELSKSVVRPVPVVWSGLASEVRLKGDFDDWGEGHLLSSDSIDDHIFKRFQAEIPLLPGTYRVKFSVDGEWRLAPDWPTEDSADGDTNNILIVDGTVEQEP